MVGGDVTTAVRIQLYPPSPSRGTRNELAERKRGSWGKFPHFVLMEATRLLSLPEDLDVRAVETHLGGGFYAVKEQRGPQLALMHYPYQ
jgi:hypothetical protein